MAVKCLIEVVSILAIAINIKITYIPFNLLLPMQPRNCYFSEQNIFYKFSNFA